MDVAVRQGEGCHVAIHFRRGSKGFRGTSFNILLAGDREDEGSLLPFLRARAEHRKAQHFIGSVDGVMSTLASISYAYQHDANACVSSGKVK